MRQIIYISTATKQVDDAEVDAILRASRLNNAAAGVSGLLLYNGHRFLQALEGEVAMVDRTYQRIKQDPRHRAVVLLSARDIDTRAFGDWAMAAQRVRSDATGAALAEQVDLLTRDVVDPNARETFRSFARVRTDA